MLWSEMRDYGITGIGLLGLFKILRGSSANLQLNYVIDFHVSHGCMACNLHAGFLQIEGSALPLVRYIVKGLGGSCVSFEIWRFVHQQGILTMDCRQGIDRKGLGLTVS
jgi:hypothetical protein